MSMKRLCSNCKYWKEAVGSSLMDNPVGVCRYPKSAYDGFPYQLAGALTRGVFGCNYFEIKTDKPEVKECARCHHPIEAHQPMCIVMVGPGDLCYCTIEKEDPEFFPEPEFTQDDFVDPNEPIAW